MYFTSNNNINMKNKIVFITSVYYSIFTAILIVKYSYAILIISFGYLVQNTNEIFILKL